MFESSVLLGTDKTDGVNKSQDLNFYMMGLLSSFVCLFFVFCNG